MGFPSRRIDPDREHWQAQADGQVRGQVMMRVRLETREGELVTTGRVPPFNIAPEVLLWGVRVFRHDRTENGVEVFREAFATYLIEADA